MWKLVLSGFWLCRLTYHSLTKITDFILWFCYRPSFDRVSIWTESLLVNLEHGGTLPPELQGDPIEYYYAVREGRAPESRSRKSLDTITEQNREALNRQALPKKCVIENITEKSSQSFIRDRSYSDNSVSKSCDLLSVACSNIEESLSDVDSPVDGVSTILDKLNFQECTSDMELSSTFGDTKFSLPVNMTSLSDTEIDSPNDQVLKRKKQNPPDYLTSNHTDNEQIFDIDDINFTENNLVTSNRRNCLISDMQTAFFENKPQIEVTHSGSEGRLRPY